MAALQTGEHNVVYCSGLYDDVNRILNTYTYKPIRRNITKAEHLALKNLRKEKDHIIVTADKGVAVVVIDKTEYITKCEGLLQDNSVDQHLSKDTSPTIHKELIKILQDYKNNNFICETEYTLLRPHGSNCRVTRFYALPKIYKIQHAHATHSFSLWCSNIQHCQIHHSNSSKLMWQDFVIDSTDFIQKIKHLPINPEEETLVSFDVSALFTGIPVPFVLQVINSKVSTCTNFTNVGNITKEKFIKLPEFSITNCIFCFNKKFYKQLQGAAVRSPVTSTIANIYFKHFESLPIPKSPTLIKWWFRFVDYVHNATRKDQVNKLQEHLSSVDPHFKFTTELLRTDGLPFLDTLTKPTESIESTAYRKPTPNR